MSMVIYILLLAELLCFQNRKKVLQMETAFHKLHKRCSIISQKLNSGILRA